MVVDPAMSPAAADENVKLTLDGDASLDQHDSTSTEEESATGRAPWWTVPVLCCAILAVSSAAAAFKFIDSAAPVTRAAWRLQVTALTVAPLAYAQWRTLAPNLQQRARQLSSLGLLVLSGASMALHFSTWVYSVDHTSLPHSLLLVCSSPVILAVSYCVACRPISWGETAGVALGAGGTTLLALSSRSDKEVSVVGDGAALLAAGAFCVYITCGKNLRDWLPLFCYYFPVTLVAALLLSIVGLVLEGAGGHVGGKLTGPVAYLQHPAYLLPVVYLALGPGIVGHAGLNAVLKYVSPLSLSLALCVEPLIGSLLGWGLGLSELPGLLTWAGGVLLVVATVITQVAGQQRLEGATRGSGDTEIVLVRLSAPEDEGKRLFTKDGPDTAVSTGEREALLEEGIPL